jgi:hypothetical protein
VEINLWLKNRALEFVVKDKGIATILHHMQLMVPPNQRSYAWTDSHVRTLYEDLSSAIWATKLIF